MEIIKAADMIVLAANMTAIPMHEEDIIKFLVWVKKNRPELSGAIFCEECSEHIGEMERKNYVLNECERGHRA